MENKKTAIVFKINSIYFRSIEEAKDFNITIMINSPDESTCINEILKIYNEEKPMITSLFSENYYRVILNRFFKKEDVSSSLGFLISTPSSTILKVSLFASYRTINQKLLAEFIYVDSVERIAHLQLHLKDIDSSYIHIEEELKEENENILIEIPHLLS